MEKTEKGEKNNNIFFLSTNISFLFLKNFITSRNSIIINFFFFVSITNYPPGKKYLPKS